MQTSIPLAFGDGEYIFALPIKQIVALEAKAGPIDAVKHRLLFGGFSILDVVETLRHGLIGGGKGSTLAGDVAVSELKANHLIDTYVDGKPLAEIDIIAKAVITALYVGYTPEGEVAQKKSVKPRKSRAASTGALSSTTASRSA